MILPPGRARAFGSLLRWLGPFTGPDAVPNGIERRTWVLREGRPCGYRGRRGGRSDASGAPRLEAYVYSPQGEAVGEYVVVPGLHFHGPADPRLDRFCRILAAAGFSVVSPFLPAFVELLVHPSAPDDLEVCARALLETLPRGRRPALFSISFGSWPALEVAARLGDAVDGVITFGGYADFEATVRFASDGVMRGPEGDTKLPNDPLNAPAVFLNVLEFLDVEGDTSDLEHAWREMTYRTWGRMELKRPGARDDIALGLSASVPERHRDLFLVGCGVRDGGPSLVDSALRRAGGALAFASPGAALVRLDCPVVVVHGRGDDVIPWGEAPKLHAMLAGRVPSRMYLTGLYGHTGAERAGLRDLAREVGNLLSIARAVAAGGALRETFATRGRLAGGGRTPLTRNVVGNPREPRAP